MKVSDYLALAMAVTCATASLQATPEPGCYYTLAITKSDHGQVRLKWNGQEFTSTVSFDNFNNPGISVDDFVTAEYTIIPDEGYVAIVGGKYYGSEAFTLTLQLSDYRTFTKDHPNLSGSDEWRFDLPTVYFSEDRPSLNGDLNLDGKLDVSDVIHLSNTILGNEEPQPLNYGSIKTSDLARVESDYMCIHKTDGSVEYVFAPDVTDVDYLPSRTTPDLRLEGAMESSVRFRAKAGQTLEAVVDGSITTNWKYYQYVLSNNGMTHFGLTITGEASPLLEMNSPDTYDGDPADLLKWDGEDNPLLTPSNIILTMSYTALHQHRLTYTIPQDGIYTLRGEITQTNAKLVATGHVSITNIHLTDAPYSK